MHLITMKGAAYVERAFGAAFIAALLSSPTLDQCAIAAVLCAEYLVINPSGDCNDS